MDGIADSPVCLDGLWGSGGLATLASAHVLGEDLEPSFLLSFLGTTARPPRSSCIDAAQEPPKVPLQASQSSSDIDEAALADAVDRVLRDPRKVDASQLRRLDSESVAGATGEQSSSVSSVEIRGTDLDVTLEKSEGAFALDADSIALITALWNWSEPTIHSVANWPQNSLRTTSPKV